MSRHIQEVESAETKNPPKRRGSRLDIQAAVALLVLSLVGDTKPVNIDDILPEDLPTLPPATAPVTPGPSSKPTPEINRTCEAGTPVKFSWPDMDINNVAIEDLGDIKTATGSRPDVPHHRDAGGAYDTAGFYEPGPRPGAEEGTPYFILHSTLIERSLLPRNETLAKLAHMRKLGKTTLISVTQDNGSTCKYLIGDDTGISGAPGSGMLLEVNKQRGYPEVFPEMFSLKKGEENEHAILAFCSGKFDPEQGTSVNIALLQGKPVN